MSDGKTTPSDNARLAALASEIEKPKMPDVQFAPLLQKAPAMLPSAIEQVFEQAAQRIEAAGEELMSMALERIAAAKAGAAQLRALGQQHARSIEGAAQFALDSAVTFKDHLERTRAFRAIESAVGVEQPK